MIRKLAPIATLLLASQLAAIGVWLVEMVVRAQQSPRDYAYLLGPSFLVIVSWATLLGGAVELVRRAGAQLSSRCRGIVPVTSGFWLCGLAIFYGLGIKTAQGAWISRQPIAPYAGWIAMALGGLALAVALYLDAKLARSQNRSLRLAWLVCLVAGATAMMVADLTLFPDLYGHLHDALAAGAWLALARSLWLASERVGAVAQGGRSSYAITIAAALLAFTLPLSFVIRASAEARGLWAARPMLSGNLHQKASETADFVRSTKRYRGAYVDSVASFAAAHDAAPQLEPERTLQMWRSLPRCASRAGEVRAAADQRIVLITVDALRADVAQAEGASLRRFGERGLHFDYAFAPASNTAGSIPALFYGALDWRGQAKSLVQALRDSGYHTAMVTAQPAFDYLRVKNLSWLEDFSERRLHGSPKSAGKLVDIAQAPEATSKLITDDAIALLSSMPAGPAFLWVHYFDLHEWKSAGQQQLEGRERYVAQWREVDREVQRLLDAIDRTSAGSTIVAFGSDHGEYLGERGRWGHTKFAGLPAIHIPLALYGPGIVAERRSDIASLMDLAPTLAALAGAPWSGGDGCDLRQTRTTAMHLVASDAAELAIIGHDRLLVVHPQMRSVELHDFRRDPTAQHNLVASEPARGTSLLEALFGSPAARAGTSLLVR